MIRTQEEREKIHAMSGEFGGRTGLPDCVKQVPGGFDKKMPVQVHKKSLINVLSLQFSPLIFFCGISVAGRNQ